jgi:alkyl hydroperoxide reductase subunit D
MDFLNTIKSRIPDYAKDIRLNLDGAIARSSLPPREAIGAALAAAFAARSSQIVDAIRGSGALAPADLQGALTAGSLMGMNNVWYPYVEMASDPELKSMRAELRMNAYAGHGGVDRRAFELWSLAASIVGRCEFCIGSHYRLLKEAGVTTQELRDVGRIAAVVHAAAQVIDAETGIAGEALRQAA